MADSSPVYLKWTLPNWITVILMVSLGAVLLGLVSSSIGQLTGNSSDTN